MSDVRVDGHRLARSLQALAEIGAYVDERTGLTGVSRLALTDADRAGRDTVVGWMRSAGLTVTVDRIGNTFGRRAGVVEGAPPVVMGSHIDSVATAGAFDGCLGVLGAVEVCRALNEAGVRTRHPIDVAFFTEEEGVRFGTDMLGSAVRAGRIPLDVALAKHDRDGLALGDELARIGYAGREPVTAPPPHAYVECHIEQGPALERADLPVAVVTGVQAITWLEVTIHGSSAHAGTTPDELRHDAFLAAARVRAALDDVVRGSDDGSVLATVGSLELRPNLTNIVPSTVVMTIDLRNRTDAGMTAVERRLHQVLAEVAAHARVSVETRELARTPQVGFDDGVQDLIGERICATGVPEHRMLSGAGHDAQEHAPRCPTGMVFVRGRYDGISHNPREHSTPDDCALGIQVLADVVTDLAEELT